MHKTQDVSARASRMLRIAVGAVPPTTSGSDPCGVRPRPVSELVPSPDAPKELREFAQACPSGDPFGERGRERDIGELARAPLSHKFFERVLDAFDVVGLNNDAGTRLPDQLRGGSIRGNRGKDRTACCEVFED